jgi:uncharacterized protein
MRLHLPLAAVLTGAALAATGVAAADPILSPPVVVAGHDQYFTLVATSEPGAGTLTTVEFYPPPDFKVSSFTASPGWHRDWTIQSRPGSLLQKAVWTRENEPGASAEELEEEQDSEAPGFSFVADPETAKTFSFEVRETYATGLVLSFRGKSSVAFPPSPPGTRKHPAPTLIAVAQPPGALAVPTTKSSGDGLSVVALVIGALGLVAGGFALVTSRRRS